MKRETTARTWARFKAHPTDTLMIQAPLPDFFHTLPILLSIPGQGTTRERVAPLAPPGEPANDK